MTQTAALLQMSGIDKSFVGVRALDQVSLTLRAGEVHALMGQNGAGKSTLIKVLTGVHAADAGRMQLDGVAVAPQSTRQAQALGIATLYQEVNLCPNLSLAENIMAGRLPRRWGWIDGGRMRAQARTALARLNMQLDEGRLLGEYAVAVQQMVAIARAVAMDARVLILDEPTSSLDEAETAQLFAVMRHLKAQGVAILFVTHFLDQVYEMADRITVLRDGRTVGEYTPAELPRLALVQAMVGRAVAAATVAPPPVVDPQAAPQLEVHGLGRRGSVRGLDFRLHAGEVVGLAGLLGSGRTESARLLFGADLADQGSLTLQGRPLHLRSPHEALRAGLAFCPEERKTDGIVAELSVRENIVLALQARRGVFNYLPRAQQDRLVREMVAALDIRAADAEMPAGQLSGGNQQKLILARWLITEPKVLILDEPTRGIDVAAQADIMNRVLELCAGGLAIVFISSELTEVLRVAHRVLVLRERVQVANLARDEAHPIDERTLMQWVAGAEPLAAAAA